MPQTFTLRDAETGVERDVEIIVDSVGIGIRPVGFGSFDMVDGAGEPVYLEFYSGVPKLYVWDDINKEDPSHIISLAGASERLRKE